MPSDPAGDRSKISLDRLRYFVEVGNRASLREAARALGIAQPALSKQMDILEEALGIRLIDRTTRGVALTALGKLVHDKASSLTQSMQRLVEYAQNLANAEVGVISIACYPVHVERFLGHVIGRFHSAVPEVTIDLTQMRDDRRRGWGRSLFDELLYGDVDIAMGPPHMDLLGLQGMKVYDAKILVLVPDEHEFRHQPTIPASALKGLQILIAPDRYFSRETVGAVAREAGIELTVGAQSSSPAALLVLGRNGLGIPILPDDYPLVGQQRFPYPVLTDIRGAEVMTEVCLQWKGYDRLSPAAQRFIDFAQEEVVREKIRGRRRESYYRADLNP